MTEPTPAYIAFLSALSIRVGDNLHENVVRDLDHNDPQDETIWRLIEFALDSMSGIGKDAFYRQCSQIVRDMDKGKP